MVNGFQTYLQHEGYTKEKAETLCHMVKGYLDWYQVVYGESLKQLRQIDIWEYFSYLSIAQRTRERELKEKLSVLRVFDCYLVKSGKQSTQGISDPKLRSRETARPSTARLSREVVDAFRRQVLASSGHRDHTIVTLIAYAGLRLEECFDLQNSSIDLPARAMTFWSRKTGITQTVPLAEEAIQALHAYSVQRPDIETLYLFPDDHGRRLTRTQLAPVFRSCPVGIAPHVLRRFYFQELQPIPRAETIRPL